MYQPSEGDDSLRELPQARTRVAFRGHDAGLESMGEVSHFAHLIFRQQLAESIRQSIFSNSGVVRKVRRKRDGAKGRGDMSVVRGFERRVSFEINTLSSRLVLISISARTLTFVTPPEHPDPTHTTTTTLRRRGRLRPHT